MVHGQIRQMKKKETPANYLISYRGGSSTYLTASLGKGKIALPPGYMRLCEMTRFLPRFHTSEVMSI